MKEKEEENYTTAIIQKRKKKRKRREMVQDVSHQTLAIFRADLIHSRGKKNEGGGDKSLARLNSRCRRTESTVSLERGVCSCAELQVFSCCRG